MLTHLGWYPKPTVISGTVLDTSFLNSYLDGWGVRESLIPSKS